jgi:outer membrane autotransporter protein
MLNTTWQGGVAVFAGTAGTVTLNAPASFQGLQFATNGYTITGSGGLTQTGAFLYASSGVGATISTVISGSGAIEKQGVGSVTLTAANTYTGGTTISDGTLGVGNNAALGTGTLTISNAGILQAAASGITLSNAIVTTAGARVDSGAGVFTLGGAISGAGSISQIGTGNLVLNGNNSFTNLGINQGTVTVGSNTAAGSAGIAINDGAILAAGVSGLVLANNIETTGGGRIDSGAGTFTLSGHIGNLGSISQIGTGNLVLNGSNNFVAGLGINQGTVTLGSNTAAGAGAITINGGATLAAGVSGLVVANAIQTTGAGRIDSGTGTFTLSGVIGNLGGITKVGTGNLILSGTSNYAGATTVSAGTLTVTGALTKSTVTAASGGTLAGTGPVAGIVVASGGRVSPGATAGAVATLATTGNVTFQAGSTYAVDLTTIADKITAAGTASLLGGTVAVAGTTAEYSFNSTYQIVSATGGRTGTFAGVTSSGFSAAFAPVLTYDGTSAYIKLAPNSIDTLLGSTPVSSNIQNVANAFDAATKAGWNPQSFYNLYLQGANLPTALNQLSGEVHSVERRASIDDARYVRDAALDRLGAGLCSLDGKAANAPDGKNTTVACTEKYALWGRYVGSWGTNQSDGNGSYYKTSVNGLIVGIDAKFNDFKVGALFSRTTDHVDVANSLGSSSVQSTGGGLYAGYRQDTGGFAAAVGGTYAGVDYRTGRSITAPGLGQTLQTDAKGNVGQLFGEVAYDLAASSTVRAEPFVRFAWVNLKADSFMEAGGYAAVVGGNQSYDTTFTTLGVRGSTNLGAVQGVSLRGSLGWMHAGGDRSPEALLAIQGTNSPASIYGVAFDEDTAAIEATIDYTMGAARFSVGYNGIIGKNTKDNGVTATLSWGF